jgi:predicted aspartyl protease
MIFGVVSDTCEAIIKVTVGRADAPKVTVDALIDTGFTSFCLCRSRRSNPSAYLGILAIRGLWAMGAKSFLRSILVII